MHSCVARAKGAVRTSTRQPLSRLPDRSRPCGLANPGDLRDLSDLADSRVVIVDDQPANVLLLQRLLTRAGISDVVGLTDSRQALDRCLADPPDLLLSDLRMPHLDGVEPPAGPAGRPARRHVPARARPHRRHDRPGQGGRPGGRGHRLPHQAVRQHRGAPAGPQPAPHPLAVHPARAAAADGGPGADRRRSARHGDPAPLRSGSGRSRPPAAWPRPDLGVRLGQAVTDIDDTIRQIRSSIFALQAPPTSRRGLRSEILALATEAAAGLGLRAPRPPRRAARQPGPRRGRRAAPAQPARGTGQRRPPCPGQPGGRQRGAGAGRRGGADRAQTTGSA